MFKSILLTTDGSELSDKAVQGAVAFAKSNGSHIVGLCVEEIYPYFPVSAISGAQDMNAFSEAIHVEALENVKKIADLARLEGVPCEVHTVTSTAPHEEIVKCAEKYHCDVIFMASHGRKGIDRFLLGSETQKVLVLSKIPVLVFK